MMQKKPMEKNYDPSAMEERIYRRWEERGYFHAKPNPARKPFTMMMPPPNVTGRLHAGHALDTTLPDIVARYKRMSGYETLWLPGTDHAAIATEVRVIKSLKAQGIEKSSLTREEFLKYAWEWTEEYGGYIVKQQKRLGASADWERSRFTMDEGCSRAVREVFVRLYEKGYIYKGSRMVNWCPCCKTSISDAEVDHEAREGLLWYIRYPFADEPGRFLEVATTRPETLPGDTAVAVNPQDERYRELIGRKLILPIAGREIPIIGDEYVDPAFGSGCVKITPAHDPNDYEVGRRHGLETICILEDDGTVTVDGGLRCQGLDRYEARRVILQELEELGLLAKTVPHIHAVGVHERCRTVIEPMVKKQWFVRMEEMAKPAIAALKEGRLRLLPESMGKTWLHWLENIHDWCISRQLWWGHPIPACTCDACGEVTVSRERPQSCPRCGHRILTDDPDTLDTWFSSAIWPFSTLGWPQKTPEYDYFYPTDLIICGYDIIFFWVIRMVFSGIEQTGSLPFHTVVFHGLVRDELGRKMEKSLGNGIDPIEVIDQYGADALRLALVWGNAPGSDMRFGNSKLTSARSFINKVWNAARFVTLNLCGETKPHAPAAASLEDRWILGRQNTLIREVTQNLEDYELGIALQKIIRFFREDFCDWYIELIKPRLQAHGSAETARQILLTSLKLLHPFIPFVTEELFLKLQSEEESIMISSWPQYRKEMELSAEDEEAMESLQTQIRIGRAQKAAQAQENGGPSGQEAARTKEKLRRELERLEQELERSQRILSNPRFLQKAPQQKVEEERLKQSRYQQKKEEIQQRLRQ